MLNENLYKRLGGGGVVVGGGGGGRLPQGGGGRGPGGRSRRGIGPSTSLGGAGGGTRPHPYCSEHKELKEPKESPKKKSVEVRAQGTEG